jgi:SSS family solute:Na+ symporter
MLAGFFLPRVSAAGAKAALFVGLAFYISMTFILQVDLHFVHVWGIEFVLNVATMLIVSHFLPVQPGFEPTEPGIVSLVEWKYARSLGVVLVVLTVGIYLWLGQAGR